MILLCVLMTHLTITCVSLYLHRSLTHGAVTFHPVLAHVMRLYLWLSTGIVSATWVGVHRAHHRHVDSAKDPHSPLIHGIWQVLLGGTFLYLKAGRNSLMMQAYARRCPRDWIERKVYSRFPYLGPALMLAFLSFLGWPGVVIWLVNFLWIPFWGAGVVNGLGHFIGYRNHETNDSSRNIVPLGVIMAGEELHNNHHANPARAKLSERWYEIDVSWGWITVFRILGLATVRS